MAMSKKTLYKWFDQQGRDRAGRHDAALRRQPRANADRCRPRPPSAIDESCFRMMGWTTQQFGGMHPSIFYDLQKYHPGRLAACGSSPQKHVHPRANHSTTCAGAWPRACSAPTSTWTCWPACSLAQIELAFDPDAVSRPRSSTSMRVNRVVRRALSAGRGHAQGPQAHQRLPPRDGRRISGPPFRPHPYFPVVTDEEDVARPRLLLLAALVLAPGTRCAAGPNGPGRAARRRRPPAAPMALSLPQAVQLRRAEQVDACWPPAWPSKPPPPGWAKSRAPGLPQVNVGANVADNFKLQK
ncbi:MAG: hypothetical protein WKG07_19250 [Hymenobacter sp.]